MKDLRSRVAVITGASAGIGAHVARRLAGEGMDLVLAARSADALEALAAELRGRGVQAHAVPTDVSDAAARVRLVERAMATCGRIDVLVNNAGIESFHEFHTLDPEIIVRTIDVNLTAALVLTRLVLPHMLSRRSGHIINMASIAGKYGPAYGAAYGASKAGLIALTQSLRGEYHGTGISASAICPGFTDDGGIYEQVKRDAGRGTPPQMGGTSADAVARAVVRALRRDLPEIIVNVPPMRPIFVTAQMFPRLGAFVVRRATLSFLRRIAKARRAP